MATRVFVSFDHDHDARLKDLLVGQSRNPDSPLEIADWSIKSASPGWKEEARRRIVASDVVAVICGHYTDAATGVATELGIAQEGKPHFLLAGYNSSSIKKPTIAKASDKVYEWTWDNLQELVAGYR